jgi:hypothetical protein
MPVTQVSSKKVEPTMMRFADFEEGEGTAEPREVDRGAV